MSRNCLHIPWAVHLSLGVVLGALAIGPANSAAAQLAAAGDAGSSYVPLTPSESLTPA